MKFCTAVCGKKYRKSTVICLLLVVFNQWSGIDAILIYATRMLENIDKVSDGQFPISPLTGTYIFGVTNAVSALLAYFALEWFGRRTLLLLG